MSKSKKFSPRGAEDLYMDLRETADDPKSVRSPTEDWYLKKLRELPPEWVVKWCDDNTQEMGKMAKKRA